MAALEDHLGTPLFRRRHRALELTDEGRRLAAATATALAALREAVQAIRTPRQREVVSLTTTPGFASLWLIPRLAQFVALHPAIGVRIEWQAWMKTVNAAGAEPAAMLTFTSYDTAVAAALEGQGVLLGRRPLTDGLVAQGRLVAPFQGQLASACGYCIVAEPVALQRPAVAAFVHWLKSVAGGGAPVPAAPGTRRAVRRRSG